MPSHLDTFRGWVFEHWKRGKAASENFRKSVAEASGPIKREKGMLNARSLNKAYGEWFGSMITEAVDEPGERNTILFVTLTFERDGSGRRRRLAEGQSLGQEELFAFNHLYNRVCRKVVGRNFHRESHRDLLPTVLAFIDAEGSKFWSTLGKLTNLHIHSIWVMPATSADQLKATLNDHLARQNGDVRFDAIDVREIEASDTQSVGRVAGYSSKLVGFNQCDLGIAEEFRVYPMKAIPHAF